MKATNRRAVPAPLEDPAADSATAPRPAGARQGFTLVAATVVGLTLAYEPFGQPYLAWIALVPWLVLVGRARGGGAAFGWGFLTGVLFFGINLWWMWTATVPGLIVLILMLGTWWAATSWALWVCGCFRGPGQGRDRRGWRSAGLVILAAVLWVGAERIRGQLILGFPWMYLAYSQTPWVVVCQVADLAGPYAISFWVFLFNAFTATAVLAGGFRRSLVPAAAGVGAVLLGVAVYGMIRLAEPTTRPGPRVMVVQANHPHLPGGAPTVRREDVAEFYLRTTEEALAGEHVDLVVWCETAMPPLNAEARSELATTPTGAFMESTHERLEQLAAQSGAAIVTGAHSVLAWGIAADGAREAKEIRNSAYLYLPDTGQSTTRYDKTNLVRMAETLPFVDTLPWMRRVWLRLAPPVAAQPMTPGDPDDPGVFTVDLLRRPPSGDLRPQPAKVRLLTPICLENIDSRIVAGLFRAPNGKGKRADLLVNLSGDGWFHPMERYQHLQCVVLRSVENRVPTARGSNTGISGFIDSCGRVLRVLPPGASGTATEDLPLDSRVAWYTRHGDVVANGCVAVALLAIPIAAARRLGNRGRKIPVLTRLRRG